MKLAGVGGGGGGGGQGGGFGRRSGTSQGVGKGATPAVSGLKPLRAGVPCASLLSASPLRVEPTRNVAQRMTPSTLLAHVLIKFTRFI